MDQFKREARRVFIATAIVLAVDIYLNGWIW